MLVENAEHRGKSSCQWSILKICLTILSLKGSSYDYENSKLKDFSKDNWREEKLGLGL
jgi:hypothetical protein